MGKNQEILAEYKAIRDEILQLNGQAFTTISVTLTINVALLGFVFSDKVLPGSEPWVIFFAILFLSAGTILIKHKIRSAHRLAFFQKYFIETQTSELRWADIYFKYREQYDITFGKLSSLFLERFGFAQTAILLLAQVVNICILILFVYDKPFAISVLLSNPFLIFAFFVVVIEFLWILALSDYSSIKNIFEKINKNEQKGPKDEGNKGKELENKNQNKN